MTAIPQISVEGLSKRYVLGHRVKHDTLRGTLGQGLRSVLNNWMRREDQEEFWALRDVSFRVERGEVLGIIGRNGAGKSTLLKILSRITDPTAGRVRLRGRVASLLEVGTGFHPELTGRENVFLNGAILGMTRNEIRRKFDEIVAFAEVERFLDTAVKHYSSGMYVRLAFAVAAHLEPDILIVDEVLAVGDAAFQRKCLGKMNEVATREGRTVLVVSHNMDSILRLCTTAVLLAQGRVVFAGKAQAAVGHYAHTGAPKSATIDCRTQERPEWIHGRMRIEQIRHANVTATAWTIPFGGTLEIVFELRQVRLTEGAQLFLAFFSVSGVEVAATQSVSASVNARDGLVQIECRIDDLRLTPGTYLVNVGLRADARMEDFITEAMQVEIVPTVTSLAQQTDAFRGYYVPHATYRQL
jgi:lipopolysaccharide transport system ATP-binding protein